MKRIFYFLVLALAPIMLTADHGRDILNGRWTSVYDGLQIKLKVRRNHIRVKGLPTNRWTRYDQVGNTTFQDCYGNRIRIHNVHDLTYRPRYGREALFIRRGHHRNGHHCNHSCHLGSTYFDTYGACGVDNGYDDRYYPSYSGSYRDYYGDYRRYDDRRRNDGPYYRSDEQYLDGWTGSNTTGFAGEYFVRELDEYIEIRPTKDGLKARRKGQNWVAYTRNRYRKNEYRDARGNTYVLRNDGSIRWNKAGTSEYLNLSKRRS